jgi:hypothetical protein
MQRLQRDLADLAAPGRARPGTAEISQLLRLWTGLWVTGPVDPRGLGLFHPLTDAGKSTMGLPAQKKNSEISVRVARHRNRRRRGIRAVVNVELDDLVVRRLIDDGWADVTEDSDGTLRVSKEELAVAVNDMVADWGKT